MDETTLRVSEVSEFVSALIQRELPDPIWIEGEIANLSRSAKGHVYFTLIEPGQRGMTGGHSISITLLNWYKEKVNLNLKRAGGNVRMGDGVRVRIRGQLELYTARSQLQLKMMAIDPVFTLGTLAAERAKLIELLRTEGLLELNRAQYLSPIPQRIGLITSVGSAAHADFMSEMERSPFAIEVTVFDSRVQGVDAAHSIIDALRSAELHEVDLIALVRGGGAKTDLAVFDEAEVARAVAASPLPVWTGLGHETDDSVADLVAHQRHKTPTACAAAVIERIATGAVYLEEVWAEIQSAAQSRLDREVLRLNMLSAAAVATPSAILQRCTDRLNDHQRHIPTLAAHGIERADAELARATTAVLRRPQQLLGIEFDKISSTESTVRAYDPAVALARGWSITRTADGTIATAADAATGERLITQLRDGTVSSVIESTDPHPPPNDPDRKAHRGN